MKFFAPNIEKLEKDGNVNELERCLRNRRPEIRLKAFSVLFDLLSPEEVRKYLRKMIVRKKQKYILHGSDTGQIDLYKSCYPVSGLFCRDRF